MNSHPELDNWVNAVILQFELPTGLEEIIPSPQYAPGFLDGKEFRIYNTVGDGNCSIHAILQIVSPAYRTLSQSNKTRLASYYRYGVMHGLKKNGKNVFRPDEIEEIKGKKYLSEEILATWADSLGYDMIRFTNHPDAIKISGPILTYTDGKNNRPYVVIFADGGHFSSVAWLNHADGEKIQKMGATVNSVMELQDVVKQPSYPSQLSKPSPTSSYFSPPVSKPSYPSYPSYSSYSSSTSSSRKSTRSPRPKKSVKRSVKRSPKKSVQRRPKKSVKRSPKKTIRRSLRPKKSRR